MKEKSIAERVLMCKAIEGCPELTPAQRLICSCILRWYQGKKPSFRVRQSTIAKRLRMTTRTVVAAMTKMKSLGIMDTWKVAGSDIHQKRVNHPHDVFTSDYLDAVSKRSYVADEWVDKPIFINMKNDMSVQRNSAE